MPKLNKKQFEILMETDKFSFNSVLDIGLGEGMASKYFMGKGKIVTATGFDVGSYGLDKSFISKLKLHENVSVEDMGCFKDKKFDAVWCSHVLEHTQNPGLALKEIRRVLKDEGYLFLIVPPYLPYVVGGHVSVGWNLGILMYNLIMAGFNIKDGQFIKHGYNLVAFVRKGSFLTEKLRYDNGDILTLSKYFPLPIQERTNGNLRQINWNWTQSNKSSFSRAKDIFLENLVILKRNTSLLAHKIKSDFNYLMFNKI